ncbi:MAG: hypothetical protein IPM82_09900 [Saprospiraceae bacterium]|nr:hypothetical protein [Saprospiraceae bacterium]
MPDNPETSSRDGYNYQILGSNLHCEGRRAPAPATPTTTWCIASPT